MKTNWKLVGSLSIAICAVALLGKRATFAQSPVPKGIAGTWNFTGNVEVNPPLPFIFVISFNSGGTTVEFDSTATGDPGILESISLGSWKQTGLSTYAFKEQNYTFDPSSGNLSAIGITTFDLTLDPDGDSVAGTGSITFYQCSVSQCPGPYITGPLSEKISGKRF